MEELGRSKSELRLWSACSDHKLELGNSWLNETNGGKGGQQFQVLYGLQGGSQLIRLKYVQSIRGCQGPGSSVHGACLKRGHHRSQPIKTVKKGHYRALRALYVPTLVRLGRGCP